MAPTRTWKTDNRHRLLWATRNGTEAEVKLLLEKGVDLEPKDSVCQTPLLWAVQNSHLAVVKLLLEKGVKLEANNKYGQTPLSWAARNGHKGLLLRKDAISKQC